MPRNVPGYVSWAKMKTRCNNPRHHCYNKYGGRGIFYVDAWESFDSFIADMGEPPGPNYTLDRIDPNGNYTKENCRWATRKQQAQNRGLRSDSPFRIAGVQQDRAGWFLSTWYENGKQVIKKHADFFEACCTRKSWEVKNSVG